MLDVLIVNWYFFFVKLDVIVSKLVFGLMEKVLLLDMEYVILLFILLFKFVVKILVIMFFSFVLVILICKLFDGLVNNG